MTHVTNILFMAKEYFIILIICLEKDPGHTWASLFQITYLELDALKNKLGLVIKVQIMKKA